MKILVLLTIAAFLFIYMQFIYEDPDRLDREGKPFRRRKQFNPQIPDRKRSAGQQ
jgi:hypothetical protein